MSDYIPEALMERLFVRLPPKTIVRMSCVCRAWNTLIHSTSFVDAHLHYNFLIPNSYNPSSNHILINHPTHFSLSDGTSILAELQIESHQRVHQDQDHVMSIVDSLYGVVCLLDKFNDMVHGFILWNPSIQGCICISSSAIIEPVKAIGFGFNSTHCDFKIIVIPGGAGAGADADADAEDTNQLVNIYSLKENNWKYINDADVPHYSLPQFENLYIYEKRCYMNGCIHWVVRDAKNDHVSLMVFSMEEERFTSMELPIELNNRRSKEVTIINGCLSVLQYRFTEGVTFQRFCEIWRMREYGVSESWIKMGEFEANLNVRSIIGMSGSKKVLKLRCYPRRGEFLSLFGGEVVFDEEEIEEMENAVNIDLPFRLESSFDINNGGGEPTSVCEYAVGSIALLDQPDD